MYTCYEKYGTVVKFTVEVIMPIPLCFVASNLAIALIGKDFKIYRGIYRKADRSVI